MLKLFQWWFSQFTLYGGGKGGSYQAPPPPDYRGAAVEQGAANRESQDYATYANRPNINTPFGSQTWTPGTTVDPSTGRPVTTWSSDITLDPTLQTALGSQQSIQQGRSQAAETLLGQATGGFEKPFDWENLPQVGDLGQAQQGAFARMAASLQPGRMQQEAGLETQLANMGLPRNSEAWNRAKAELQGRWTQEDKTLLGQAGSEGRADLASQMGRRQQAIAEQAQRRGMTLNELNALLSGQQVSMPQMPGFATAQAPGSAPLFGAATAGGQYGLDAAQQNLNAYGATKTDWGSAIGGIAGLAALALL